MCLEQWSWVAAIISAVVALIVLVVTIIGAVWAWRNKHAPRLSTGIVISTDTGVYGTGTPLGLRLRDDLLVDIRAPVVNLTSNRTRYRLSISGWFAPSGPYYNPIEPGYRGEIVRESPPRDVFEGHFFINLSSVLSQLIDGDTVTPKTNVGPILEYLSSNILHVSTRVDYEGFLPWLLRQAHEPTFEYYFVPTGQPAIPGEIDPHGHYSVFIPGQWVPGNPR